MWENQVSGPDPSVQDKAFAGSRRIVDHPLTFRALLFFVGTFSLGGILALLALREYELELVEYHQELSRQSTRTAASEIKLLMTELRRTTRLFANYKSDLFERFRGDPDNETLYGQIDDLLADHFPEYSSFTLADLEGNLVHDDLGEFVGPLCLENILASVHEHDEAEILVHPGPGDYHFDVMVAWQHEGEPRGVFFTSYTLDMLVRVLLNGQPQGHQRMLVRKSMPSLIEVTAEGGRDQIYQRRPIHLSDEELSQIGSQEVVGGTGWLVIDLFDERMLDSYTDRLAAPLLFAALFMLLLSGVSLLVIRWEERRRMAIEAALVNLNNSLETKVQERTANLAEANRQMEQEIERRARAEVELKQHQEVLRHSEKMRALGTLSGGIAHDFNNILGVMLGYSDLLKCKLADNEKLCRYACQINQAAYRGKQLTTRLLAFSHKNQPQASYVDLNLLILEGRQMLEKSLTHSIRLKLDLDSQVHPLFLDSSMLEDSILNMAINAMHAMPDGGELIISTRNCRLGGQDAAELDLSPGDYVLLRLRDTGVGMDQETARQVFEPFFSTKGKEKGTGLGMSQVYGFVQQSAGSIRVDSRAGAGTTFSLYLPAWDEQAGAVALEGGEQSSPVPGGDEHILVVDDEIALRELAAEVLAAKGYRVSCVADGVSALESMEQDPAQLVVSDIAMPVMDGYELAEQIGQRFPDARRMFVSGFGVTPSKGARSLELFEQRLSKPFSPEELLRKVREVLDQHELAAPER
jgi:signal transduction histidine kinase/ActR/RegA family two-component response regulator